MGITKSGFVNPDRVQLIMQELGKMEDQIFKDRQDKELSFKARNKAKRRRERLEQNRQPKWVPGGQFAPMPLGGGRHDVAPVSNAKQEAMEMRKEGMSTEAGANIHPKDRNKCTSAEAGLKDINIGDSDSEEETPDEVRLYEDGFKDRYYESKFGVLPEQEEFRFRVAAEYTLGL